MGVPGLINAYKSATEDALNHAKVIKKTVNDIYRIQFDYLQMNDVMKIVKEDDLAILTQDFEVDCSITVSIRKTMVNQVLGRFEQIGGIKLRFDNTL